MRSNVPPLSEPKIDDMFSDPVFHAVLKRDGLTVDDIRQVIETYRQSKPEKTN